MTDYTTKDSGERQHFTSGMQRDTEVGKPRFDLLVPDGVPYEEQLLTRFAGLLARGAEKYTERNWEQADSMDEVRRAKSSAFRHFFQWLTGETDEDHAAATLFNIMVVETISRKIRLAEEAEALKPGPFAIWQVPEATVGWRDPEPITLDLKLESVPRETIALAFGIPVDELNDFASNTLEDDEAADAAADHVNGVQNSFDRYNVPVEDLRM